MNRRNRQLSEEYLALLNQNNRHTYSQKRKAARLARICSLENLLPCSPLQGGYQKACEEAKSILQSERKKNEDAIINVLAHIMQTGEDETFLYAGALGLPLGTPDEMADIFLGIQRLYSKDSGRRIRHECLSLTLDEPFDTEGKNRVIELCGQFALFYFYSGFQTVFSIHRTSGGFHAHYAVNTVSFYDGLKYPSSARLLEYQQSYAYSLLCALTGKCTCLSPITWEEFEYSDSLYIPPRLFEVTGQQR